MTKMAELFERSEDVDGIHVDFLVSDESESGVVVESAGPDCGANAKGGGGFQKGNTCAGGDGQGQSPAAPPAKPGFVKRLLSWITQGTAEKREARIDEAKRMAGGELHRTVKARMAQYLDHSPLPAAKKAEYRAAIDSVVGAMNDKALRRLHANVDDMLFKETSIDVTHEMYEGKVSRAHIHMSGRITMGYYERHKENHSGRLVLDGDPPPEFGVSGVTRDVYAHELTHAIDYEPNSRTKISDSDDWKAAWEGELKGDGLTKQASRSAVEGFAEFGRIAMFAPDKARELFPKSWSVWANNGLGK